MEGADVGDLMGTGQDSCGWSLGCVRDAGGQSSSIVQGQWEVTQPSGGLVTCGRIGTSLGTRDPMGLQGRVWSSMGDDEG